MVNQFLRKALILVFAGTLLGSCSKSKNGSVEPETETPLQGQYLIAVGPNGATSNVAPVYMLTANSLEDANSSLTIVNNGLEINQGFNHFFQNGYLGLVGLNYTAGTGSGTRLSIDRQGKPVELGGKFDIENGFVSLGMVGGVGYTASALVGDNKNQIIINRIPMDGSVPQNTTVRVDNLPGYAGKSPIFMGFTDAGNSRAYTSLFFVNDRTIDDAIVARINLNTGAIEAVFSDARLGVSGATVRSARYSQIGTADNGDVYVFSGNHFGTKKGGALVIRSGATAFDQNYFWNIEDDTQSQGYRFRKVWNLYEDKFLIEFYNDKYPLGTAITGAVPAASQYAIVDMSDKKLTWISGLPAKELIPTSNALAIPYYFEGKIYFPITTATNPSRFYVVDPATAVAKPGLRVDGGAIIGVTFVEKK